MPVVVISDKQLAANRANAARSTGPTSARGKSISAQNSLSHGLCSNRLTIFHWESQTEYDAIRASFSGRFRPLDHAELALVDRMVDCTWRRNRILAIETTLFELDISDNEKTVKAEFPDAPDDGLLRMAITFRSKHGEGSTLAVQRYLTSVERSYSRARRELEILQKDRFNALSADEIVEAATLAAVPPEPEPEPEPQPQQREKQRSTKRTHLPAPRPFETPSSNPLTQEMEPRGPSETGPGR